jgi:hypothetical protein
MGGAAPKKFEPVFQKMEKREVVEIPIQLPARKGGD